VTSLKAKNTRIAGKCDYIQKEHQSTSFKDLREMKIKKKYYNFYMEMDMGNVNGPSSMYLRKKQT
jgi:hypothetical protein